MGEDHISYHHRWYGHQHYYMNNGHKRLMFLIAFIIIIIITIIIPLSSFVIATSSSSCSSSPSCTISYCNDTFIKPTNNECRSLAGWQIIANTIGGTCEALIKQQLCSIEAVQSRRNEYSSCGWSSYMVDNATSLIGTYMCMDACVQLQDACRGSVPVINCNASGMVDLNNRTCIPFWNATSTTIPQHAYIISSPTDWPSQLDDDNGPNTLAAIDTTLLSSINRSIYTNFPALQLVASPAPLTDSFPNTTRATGWSASSPVRGLYLILLVVYLCITATCSSLAWSRRTIQPLRARMIWLVIGGAVIGGIYMICIIHLVAYGTRSYCFLIMFMALIVRPSHTFVHAVRSAQMWFLYRWSQDKVTQLGVKGARSWYFEHRHWISPLGIAIVATVHCIIALTLFFAHWASSQSIFGLGRTIVESAVCQWWDINNNIITAARSVDATFTTTFNDGPLWSPLLSSCAFCELTTPAIATITIFNGIYELFLLIGTWRMRHARDQYYMWRESFWSSIILIACGPFITLATAESLIVPNPFSDQHQRTAPVIYAGGLHLDRFVIIISIVLPFLFSLIIPLALSFTSKYRPIKLESSPSIITARGTNAEAQPEEDNQSIFVRPYIPNHSARRSRIKTVSVVDQKTHIRHNELELTLHTLLTDTVGANMALSCAVEMFAPENVQFYFAVTKYRALFKKAQPDRYQCHWAATQIYHAFIPHGAPNELTIPPSLRDHVERRFRTLDQEYQEWKAANDARGGTISGVRSGGAPTMERFTSPPGAFASQTIDANNGFMSPHTQSGINNGGLQTPVGFQTPGRTPRHIPAGSPDCASPTNAVASVASAPLEMPSFGLTGEEFDLVFNEVKRILKSNLLPRFRSSRYYPLLLENVLDRQSRPEKGRVVAKHSGVGRYLSSSHLAGSKPTSQIESVRPVTSGLHASNNNGGLSDRDRDRDHDRDRDRDRGGNGNGNNGNSYHHHNHHQPSPETRTRDLAATRAMIVTAGLQAPSSSGSGSGSSNNGPSRHPHQRLHPQTGQPMTTASGAESGGFSHADSYVHSAPESGYSGISNASGVASQPDEDDQGARSSERKRRTAAANDRWTEELRHVTGGRHYSGVRSGSSNNERSGKDGSTRPNYVHRTGGVGSGRPPGYGSTNSHNHHNTHASERGAERSTNYSTSRSTSRSHSSGRAGRAQPGYMFVIQVPTAGDSLHMPMASAPTAGPLSNNMVAPPVGPAIHIPGSSISAHYSTLAGSSSSMSTHGQQNNGNNNNNGNGNGAPELPPGAAAAVAASLAHHGSSVISTTQVVPITTPSTGTALNSARSVVSIPATAPNSQQHPLFTPSSTRPPSDTDTVVNVRPQTTTSQSATAAGAAGGHGASTSSSSGVITPPLLALIQAPSSSSSSSSAASTTAVGPASSTMVPMTPDPQPHPLAPKENSPPPATTAMSTQGGNNNNANNNSPPTASHHSPSSGSSGSHSTPSSLPVASVLTPTSSNRSNPLSPPLRIVVSAPSPKPGMILAADGTIIEPAAPPAAVTGAVVPGTVSSTASSSIPTSSSAMSSSMAGSISSNVPSGSTAKVASSRVPITTTIPPATTASSTAPTTSAVVAALGGHTQQPIVTVVPTSTNDMDHDLPPVYGPYRPSNYVPAAPLSSSMPSVSSSTMSSSVAPSLSSSNPNVAAQRPTPNIPATPQQPSSQSQPQPSSSNHGRQPSQPGGRHHPGGPNGTMVGGGGISSAGGKSLADLQSKLEALAKRREQIDAEEREEAALPQREWRSTSNDNSSRTNNGGRSGPTSADRGHHGYQPNKSARSMVERTRERSRERSGMHHREVVPISHGEYSGVDDNEILEPAPSNASSSQNAFVPLPYGLAREPSHGHSSRANDGHRSSNPSSWRNHNGGHSGNGSHRDPDSYSNHNSDVPRINAEEEEKLRREFEREKLVQLERRKQREREKEEARERQRKEAIAERERALAEARAAAAAQLGQQLQAAQEKAAALAASSYHPSHHIRGASLGGSGSGKSNHNNGGNGQANNNNGNGNNGDTNSNNSNSNHSGHLISASVGMPLAPILSATQSESHSRPTSSGNETPSSNMAMVAPSIAVNGVITIVPPAHLTMSPQLGSHYTNSPPISGGVVGSPPSQVMIVNHDVPPSASSSLRPLDVTTTGGHHTPPSIPSPSSSSTIVSSQSSQPAVPPAPVSPQPVNSNHPLPFSNVAMSMSSPLQLRAALAMEAMHQRTVTAAAGLPALDTRRQSMHSPMNGNNSGNGNGNGDAPISPNTPVTGNGGTGGNSPMPGLPRPLSLFTMQRSVGVSGAGGDGVVGSGPTPRDTSRRRTATNALPISPVPVSSSTPASSSVPVAPMTTSSMASSSSPSMSHVTRLVSARRSSGHTPRTARISLTGPLPPVGAAHLSAASPPSSHQLMSASTLNNNDTIPFSAGHAHGHHRSNSSNGNNSSNGVGHSITINANGMVNSSST